MSTFPKTRTAAGYVARHGPGDLARARAATVLTRLDACETAMAGGYGEMPAIVHGMLRDLVLAVRDLVSRAWLAADSDAPDIAAFTALESIPVPPAPADLDEIISRVLWARFTPRRGARQGTGHQRRTRQVLTARAAAGTET